MKRIYITYLIAILSLLIVSCSNDSLEDTTPSQLFPDKWEEEVMDGASATIKGFKPGDEVTRTSLSFDSQNLIFGWTSSDRLGLYPTAKDITSLLSPSNAKTRVGESSDGEGESSNDQQIGEGASSGNQQVEEGSISDNITAGLLSQADYPHPLLSQNPNLYRVDPEVSYQSLFGAVESSSQTTRIVNGASDFMWDDVVRWTAYLPYSNPQSENYEGRLFSFQNQEQNIYQTQTGLPVLGELFDYEDRIGNVNEHLSKYLLSEKNACDHLGKYDVMISPETEWVDGTRINFKLRHVGAVARVYLKVPEENLVIKDLKLICDKPIFYQGGSFNLISHPYEAQLEDKGVDFNSQIQPDGAPVKMIQLNFSNNCVTKKSGSGNYGPYVVAYIMMYPITYTPATDGNLFAYVTAYRQGDDPSKEVHYVSDPLAGKTMVSGNYYQWTTVTHEQDGLYPIELTATLLPWQDIVGAGIETDLTK